MKKFTAEEFKALTAKEKRIHIENVIATFDNKYNEVYDNTPSKIGLSMFKWIDLDTKDPMTAALAKRLNATTTKIFKNYRGSKTAWYQGSQNDQRIIDAIDEAARTLYNDCGIKCSVGFDYD